ncbi:MAG: diacylglycerol/lipid kinase family protein, partial [Candidatus Acidiferrales bacterium]
MNPTAGGGRRVPQLDEARRIFREAGIETELQETTEPGEATRLARRCVEQSRQLVVVCGGDGTVNEAVNGLACSQVPLAVLPSGTANVLAKELGLPWNLPRAAKRIAGAPYQRIALGLAIPEKS